MTRPVDKTPAVVRAALDAWVEWLMTWRLSEGAMHRQNELWERRQQIIGGVPGSPVLADVLAAEDASTAWPEALHRAVCEYPLDWRYCLLGAAVGLNQDDVAKELSCHRKHVGVMTNAALRIFTIDVRVLTFTRRRQDQAASDAAYRQQQRERGYAA